MFTEALLLAQKLQVASTCNCLDMHIASVAFDQVVPVVIANKLTLFSCRSRGISSRLASQQMSYTQIYKIKVNIHKWLSNNLPIIHFPLKERLFDCHLCMLTFFSFHFGQLLEIHFLKFVRFQLLAIYGRMQHLGSENQRKLELDPVASNFLVLAYVGNNISNNYYYRDIEMIRIKKFHLRILIHTP